MGGGTSRFATTLGEWGVELRDDQLFIGQRLAALCQHARHRRARDALACDRKAGDRDLGIPRAALRFARYVLV
jgi:hypothetical protein